MPKKLPPKKPKIVSVKPSSTGNTKVLSLIDKLEKKTEKQMASFVKEIVKLKKNQVKLAEKLEQSKKNAHTQVKKTKSSLKKKQKPPKLKIVENMQPKTPIEA